ncbi:MAG: hypothetical protein HWN66_01990 [Candidatus Helarchaeota archaeon]|nr:hypothetical protein [Candidatus Helarchaeota archaeon]
MELVLFIFYILVYIYTGFSLKLIDQVNDENFELNPIIKIGILFSSPILAGIVMGMDIYNASVGLMLILGLFVTKKINVLDFKIYAVFVITSMLVVSVINQFYVFLNFLLILPTTIILLFAVIADELLNEFLDSKNIKNPFFKKLASIRPILKIIIFILPLFNLFTFFHAIMMLSFDIAYDLTRYFTERKMNKEKDSNLVS